MHLHKADTDLWLFKFLRLLIMSLQINNNENGCELTIEITSLKMHSCFCRALFVWINWADLQPICEERTQFPRMGAFSVWVNVWARDIMGLLRMGGMYQS